MAFVSALKAEIAQLEAALAADPIWVKLQELQRVLRLYEDRETAQVPTPVSLDQERKRRTTSPVRQAALEKVRLLLNLVDTPVPTATLYTALKEQGIELGGENPKNNLSALLHHSDDFVSHGRAGWTLRENDLVRFLKLNPVQPEKLDDNSALLGALEEIQPRGKKPLG
jgi:hypothetical protein